MSDAIHSTDPALLVCAPDSAAGPHAEPRRPATLDWPRRGWLLIGAASEPPYRQAGIGWQLAWPMTVQALQEILADVRHFEQCCVDRQQRGPGETRRTELTALVWLLDDPSARQLGWYGSANDANLERIFGVVMRVVPPDYFPLLADDGSTARRMVADLMLLEHAKGTHGQRLVRMDFGALACSPSSTGAST